MRSLLMVVAVGLAVLMPAVAQEAKPGSDTTTSDGPADGRTFCRSLLVGQKYADGLQAACEYSRSVTRLANYLCEQRTLLSTQVLGDMDPMHNIPAHEIIAQVRVVDGTESYDIKQGAGSNKSASMFDVSGATGQYSSLLQALFDPRNQPEFSFSKEEVLHSTPALVYKFNVRRESNKTLWFLQSNGVVAYPGYSGQLWIQQKTGQLMRLEMESTDLPSGFPFDSRVSVDYAEAAIGDGSKFVLPVKAHTVMCRTRYPNCNHNRTTFSKFRKFAAEHRIVPSE